MWIVISTKNYEFLSIGLFKKVSNAKVYFPKIKLQNNKIKNILGNYIFCHSEYFNWNKSLLTSLKTLKGLNHILFSDYSSQKEINEFISLCKLHEDSKGFIKNSFFKNKINDMGKMLNGPFTNYIFKILQKDKSRIKALIGNVKFSILDKSKFNYLSI